MIDFNFLESGLRKSGLENGDVVLLHSSFKSFGGVEGGPQTVVDAFISVLGEEGTLIVPTYNFDFSSHNKSWDLRTTPSQMGIISEFVRLNTKSQRIFHPIYSFSILGKLAEELGSLRIKSSFGTDSIFAKLRELNGKIMQIDSVYKGTTFFHHIEEMEGCTYRYLKEFTGNVTDKTGKTYKDTFSILVRDLDQGIVTNIKPIGEILIREEIIKVSKIGDATIWLMNSNDLYERTALERKNNPYLLCHTDRKLIGKVVLITCATLKIEKDIAKSFVKQGATLMLISKNKELLEKNTRELGVYNDFDVHFEMADIQNDIDVKNIINKTIKKLGKIDILVNNAGIFRDLNTLNEISKFESDKIMDVNFWIE